MLGANSGCVCRKWPSSTTDSITVVMSYGWLAESGTRVSRTRSSSRGSVADSSSAGSATGGVSRLLDGRNDSRSLT